MKGATAPQCPLDGCLGTFVWKTSKRGNKYRQCDTCGAFVSRYLTKEEKARKMAEKAQRKPSQAELLASYQKERKRLNALPQLPLWGWTPADWFPELGEMRQGRFIL